MFFESNRSSREGLVAVGTVVMNRLNSGDYGNSVCGVVGQKGQFAPGVLSRKMNSSALPDVMAAADAVLKGERHPAVKNAMFFHTAGLRFPYRNMHYVLQAGGNAFYEKRNRHRMPQYDADTRLANAAAPQEQNVAETRKVATANPAPAAKGRWASATPMRDSAASSFRSNTGDRGSAVAVATVRQAVGATAQEASAVVLPEGNVPVPQTSMPSAARFGHDAGVQQAAIVTGTTSGQTALSYEADPKSVDAIGALIARQARPLTE